MQKKAVQISYQSFSARQPQQIVFHVWWLKEFKNRWFAVGVKDEKLQVQNLALDRIIDIQTLDNELYIANESLSPDEYYKDVIGVTVSINLRPITIKIWVSNQHAPYVETKPLHQSQEILERQSNGILIQLKVQHNFELEREIFGFGDGMVVLEPQKLRGIIKKWLEKAVAAYL